MAKLVGINHVALVQFERTPGVKRKLGIDAVEKSEEAKREIEDKGLS